MVLVGLQVEAEPDRGPAVAEEGGEGRLLGSMHDSDQTHVRACVCVCVSCFRYTSETNNRSMGIAMHVAAFK